MIINNGDILRSSFTEDNPFNTTGELKEWISNLNLITHVSISECSISDSDFWFYDDYKGEILNRKSSFFSVTGVRRFINDSFQCEQPIIVQPEIGYLGIIAKKINGVLYFLMQAKIEPGNINRVQISPTLQATKSNFTRAHGGKLPAYFDYFERSNDHNVIYDQIQSEQGTRFLRKRNRNMILYVEEDVEILPGFKWMTLGQIKSLMKEKNLVNMDTRTVLSGLPVFCEDSLQEFSEYIRDDAFLQSYFYSDIKSELPALFHKVNNYKMFQDIHVSLTPLNQLLDWKVSEFGIRCIKPYDFDVSFYNIEISGREVKKWMQPLFKSNGMSVFGLISTVIEGVKKYLIQIQPEIGSFDKVEFGPTICWGVKHSVSEDNSIDTVFRHVLDGKEKGQIIYDNILSEEGGRFYQEQNRNVIIEIPEALDDLPDEYQWVTYNALNYLIQINNCINIQLRNLVSLIDIRGKNDEE